MAFSDFRYPAVIRDFGLSEGSADLFPDVPPGPAADLVRRVGAPLAVQVNTEKARSEWMVALVLADLWDRRGRRINLHSGVEFPADPAAKLNGYCDFLIGRAPQASYVRAPVVVIFEAKRDSIPDGLGQCVAGMVGVQRFNQKEGRPIDPVYGCGTTGTSWRFLSLSGTAVTLDLTEYTIAQVDKLLGILTHIVGPPPPGP